MRPSENKMLRTTVNTAVEVAVKVAFEKKIEPNGFTIKDLARVAEDATSKAHKKAMQTSVELITEVDGYLCASIANGPKVPIRKLEKPKEMLPLQFNLR